MEVELTDNGIRLTAPDHHDELRCAGSNAVLMAEAMEARYGEDADLARAFLTANSFAQDVLLRDRVLETHRDDEGFDPDDPNNWARGQFADVVLLGAAAGWSARIHARDHNEGRDPEEAAEAAEFMVDVWDTLFRQMGLAGIRGDMDETEYRYGKHHKE